VDDELVIDVKGLVDDALNTRQSDEDLDEALLRAAKSRHGDRALEVFNALDAALDFRVKRSGKSREEALRDLAGPMIIARSAPRVTKSFSFGKRAAGPKGTVSRTFSFTTSAKSMEELPPERRDEIARTLEEAAQRIEAMDRAEPGETPEGTDPNATHPAALPPIGPTLEEAEAAQKPRSLRDRLRNLLG
jgi:hypothetical protein